MQIDQFARKQGVAHAALIMHTLLINFSFWKLKKIIIIIIFMIFVLNFKNISRFSEHR